MAYGYQSPTDALREYVRAVGYDDDLRVNARYCHKSGKTRDFAEVILTEQLWSDVQRDLLSPYQTARIRRLAEAGPRENACRAVARDYINMFYGSANRKSSRSRTKRGWVRSRNAAPFTDDGIPDPYMVETREDMRAYMLAHDPGYGRYLNDPRVWGWVNAYLDYLAWNEHGNEASLGELIESGGIAMLISDLTGSPDASITEYLVGYDGIEHADGRAVALLEDRAAIQAAYGAPVTAWNRRAVGKSKPKTKSKSKGRR